MNKLKEFLKLFFIFSFIFKNIFESLIHNSRSSKNTLTEVYLKYLFSKSKIQSITLAPSANHTFLISSLQLFDYEKSLNDRFSLLTYEELFSLLTILRIKPRKKIFEFGLLKGGSLYHFFLNSKKDTTIDSLDLNFNNLNVDVKKIIDSNPLITVHQLNSHHFDPIPFRSLIDFVFIDGGHDYATVKNDSEKALTMLKPGGCIVWDDYNPDFPGVFKYINELGLIFPHLVHIHNTSLVWLNT